MNRLHYPILILILLALCACGQTKKTQFQPWTQLEIEKLSIKKEKHSDPGLNAVMNAAVEAAKRAGFIYDGSKSKTGDISVNTRWGTDTVTINVTFSKDAKGELVAEHNWKCNGQTVYEEGDKYVMNIFFSAWDAVMRERRSDPYNPKYD